MACFCACCVRNTENTGCMWSTAHRASTTDGTPVLDWHRSCHVESSRHLLNTVLRLQDPADFLATVPKLLQNRSILNGV